MGLVDAAGFPPAKENKPEPKPIKKSKAEVVEPEPTIEELIESIEVTE